MIRAEFHFADGAVVRARCFAAAPGMPVFVFGGIQSEFRLVGCRVVEGRAGEDVDRVAPDAPVYIYEQALSVAGVTCGQPGDNATEELLALARSGDRAGFDALAGCLMPAEKVGECWSGARQRLGGEEDVIGSRLAREDVRGRRSEGQAMASF